MPEVAIKEPQAFKMLGECFNEVCIIKDKLSPVMAGPRPEKVGGATPDTTELELRLGSLLSELRELSGRIKI